MYWPLVILGLMVSAIILALVLATAAQRIPAARRWAILATASAVAIPLAVVLHNVLSAITGGEEAVSFILALVIAPIGFMIALLGGGLAIAGDPGEHDLATSLLIAAMGMAIFGAYGLFALVVTAMYGGTPPYQEAVEDVVVPVSVIALAAGALFAVAAGRRPRARASR